MGRLIELTDGSALVCKSRVDVIEKAESDGPIIAVVSDELEDNEGDIIHADGWDLGHFNKSPLLLWSHDRWTPNLSAPETRAYVDGAVLKVSAVHDMGDSMAAFLDGKVRRGTIKETSVAFRGREWTERERGIEWKKQELIEVSWVNRGMNPRTDVLAKGMLRDRPDLLAKVATGDDGEADELKAELAEMSERIAVMERLIAKLGDGQDERMDAMFKAMAVKNREDAALESLLTRCKELGFAR